MNKSLTCLSAAAISALGLLSACSAGVEAKPADNAAPTSVQSTAAVNQGNVDINVSAGGEATTESTESSNQAKESSSTTVSSPEATQSALDVAPPPGTTQVSCTQSQEIDGVGEVVAFTGECGTIKVSGMGAVIYFESVDELILEGTGVVANGVEAKSVSVSADGAVVTVTEDISKLTVSGMGNSVTTGGAIGQLDDSGLGTVISQAG